MNSSLESLQDLQEIENQPENQPVVYEAKIDSLGRAYATGKRKNSIARVWIKPGTGKITINLLDVEKYLTREVLRMIVNQPFAATSTENKFDTFVKVSGGGLSGQAGAIKHGISKALFAYNPEHRTVLKKEGFITRDSRVVERKKYGLAKARKSYQFSKR